MSIHPRATEPKEMIEESINENLFAINYCLNFRKSSEKGLWENNNITGALGFPAAILLLSLVDAIGGYYEGNKDLLIKMRGSNKIEMISGDPKSHFYILNSKLFNLNLSAEEISAVFYCRNSLLHNNVLTGNIKLVNETREPFIETVYDGQNKYIEFRLQSFYAACMNAVKILYKELPNLVIGKFLKNRTSFHITKMPEDDIASDFCDIEEPQTT